MVGLYPATDREVLVCEVATHLADLGYGTARENREPGARTFRNAEAHVDRAFPWAEAVRFQFSSPIVRPKSAGELREATAAFEAETGRPLELVVNEAYTDRIEALRTKAAATEAQRGDPGFRFLQILEHLR